MKISPRVPLLRARARVLAVAGIVGLAAIMQITPASALNEPQLVSTSPEAGATVAAALSKVTAVYDRDIQGAPASSFTLEDGTGTQVAGTVGLDSSTTISFSPAGGSLTEAGSPYTAAITVYPLAEGDPTTTTFGFGIDATAPDAPIIIVPAEGDLTNAEPVHVTGTAEPGVDLRLLESDAELATGTADGAGDFDIELTLGNEDGVVHALELLAVDAAGNESTPATVSFTHDNVASAAPSIDTPASDVSTSNTSVTLGGAAAEDGDVLVFEGDELLDTVIAVGGSWSVTVSDLTEAAHPFSASARDAAGNTSDASAIRTVTVDLTAPVVPSVEVLPAPLNGATQSDVTVSGTAEPGSAITVEIDDENALTAPASGSATTDQNGDYAVSSLDLSGLNDGDLAVSVTSADAAGNTSQTALTVAKDATAPAAPIVDMITEVVNASNQTEVALEGTGEDATTATITVSGGAGETPLEQQLTLVDGAFSASFDASSLQDGPLTVSVTLTDASGNTGPASEHVVLKDTLAPGAPAILSPADGSTFDVTTFTVDGTAEPGATVDLSEGEDALASVVAAADGTWTTEVTVGGDGDRLIEALQTDTAGNPGSASDAVEVLVDTEAPSLRATNPANGAAVRSTLSVEALYSETLQSGSLMLVNRVGTIVAGTTTVEGSSLVFTPSGSLTEAASPFAGETEATDRADRNSGISSFTFAIDATAPAAPAIERPADQSVIRATTATFEGTAEANASVRLVDAASNEIGTATADGLGRWSRAVSLGDGSYAISAIAVDAAGNESPASPAVRISIQTAPTITTPLQGAVTQSSVTISGVAPAGWSVTVTEAGRFVGAAPVNGSGTWSMTASFPSGSHTIIAIGRSSSGQLGNPSAPRTFIVDATRPQVAITTEENRIFGPGEAFTVSGTATDDYGVRRVRIDFYNVAGTQVATMDATLDAPDGAQTTWTATGTGLVPGRYTVRATALDVNGLNSTTAARTFLVVIL